MNITNTHKREIGLPNGQMIPPNTPTPVDDWDNIRKNAVVAAWLKAGILHEGDRANLARDAAEAAGPEAESAKPAKARPGPRVYVEG